MRPRPSTTAPAKRSTASGSVASTAAVTARQAATPGIQASARARSTTASPATAWVTSTPAVQARSAAPSGNGGSCRAHRPRASPAWAKRAANRAPRPRLAPVTTATRPATSGPGPPAPASTVRAMSGFEQAVVRVLQSLGPGDVVTYGEVAAEAGFPGAARAVGRLLATSGDELPWWRVVTATGRLVPGHEREQARRLAAEGVAVVDGRVAPVEADAGR